MVMRERLYDCNGDRLSYVVTWLTIYYGNVEAANVLQSVKGNITAMLQIA